MNIVEKPLSEFRKSANRDLTLFQLKTAIILWSVVIIILTLFISDKWILAGILAYEILP